MAVGAVTGTYRKLQGVWKTTPKTCGKQGKNSARWLSDVTPFLDKAPPPNLLSLCPLRLLPCFLACLQYNRCAYLRGRNEFQRASLLLRSVCLFGPLPSRSPQLSDAARDEFDRALWRPGMVPGYLRGSDRGPAGLSTRSLPCLSDPGRLVLLAWFDRIFVACASTKLYATGGSRDDSSGSASVGGRPGEALRCRHDRPGLQRECPLHRLLHLLHFGEHRRRDR